MVNPARLDSSPERSPVLERSLLPQDSSICGPLLIGTVAGVLCYYALIWRVKKGFDESLDAWSIHGVGGFWGTIACGIFATAAVGGASGLIEGNAYLLGIQILDACVTAVFAFGMTYLLAWIVDKTVGLRVSEDEEYIGLDLTLHGEMVR